ncbi:Hypothetical predicted protein [Octopus vulgaris]|uniref:Uncharacterized protein n=1 Tax=Octopus vulgaris TaxID=6645 RepID=A0AA36FF76_OCTVU|nr:Hypothetical predicted protein [Octopus vulgaris]
MFLAFSYHRSNICYIHLDSSAIQAQFIMEILLMIAIEQETAVFSNGGICLAVTSKYRGNDPPQRYSLQIADFHISHNGGHSYP